MERIGNNWPISFCIFLATLITSRLTFIKILCLVLVGHLRKINQESNAVAEEFLVDM